MLLLFSQQLQMSNFYCNPATQSTATSVQVNPGTFVFGQSGQLAPPPEGSVRLTQQQYNEAVHLKYPEPKQLFVFSSSNALHPGRPFIGTASKDFCYWADAPGIPFGFIRTKEGKLIDKKHLKTKEEKTTTESKFSDDAAFKLVQELVKTIQGFEQNSQRTWEIISGLERRIQDLERPLSGQVEMEDGYH